MKKKIINNIQKVVSENFKFWEVIILMGLTAIVGISAGGFIIKKSNGLDKTGSLSPALQEFVNNYNYIANNYYGEFDEEELLNEALETILEKIDDPYAAYMDELESSNFDIYLSGSYRGIGIEVANLTSTGELIITNVIEDSPSAKSGLKVGDLIIKVNDEIVSSMSSTDFSNKIKAETGEFTLTILRNEIEKTFNINLETVVIKSVDTNLFDNHIGYVHIAIFADNTYAQLKEKLAILNDSGMKSLIIDLRGNTGGYLSSVEKILGLFLDSSHVIYQIKDKNGITKFYSKGNETVTYEIVILTNETTASASEIFTAALKEEIYAISVGKKTYGKGSAQKLHMLSDGSMYKFTTQKWLTPTGSSIDNVGIEVDYDVEISDDYYTNPSIENDRQLQFAIELLS